eukprot:SAG31_NODE_3037_length_4761_cov_2.884384_2_plen_202_part_00
MANLWGRNERAHDQLELSAATMQQCVRHALELTHPVNHAAADADPFGRTEISYGGVWPLDELQALPILNMCVSDKNKLKMLGCPNFLDLLIDGLLLSPEHPRKNSDPHCMAVVQRDFAECLYQMSLFPPSHDRLSGDPRVIPALEDLAVRGFTMDAQRCAEGALLALGARENSGGGALSIGQTVGADHVAADSDNRHIMRE